MQDYDGPSSPYHPLIGEGAWPDHYVNMVVLLALIIVFAACYLAYRLGQRRERERYGDHRKAAPEIIYNAVRRDIDRALIAVGESAFGPIGVLLATIDAYLGSVLVLGAGPNSMIGSIDKLKKASVTTVHPASAGRTVDGRGTIPASAPVAAAAAAAVGGVSVQVINPVQACLPEGGSAPPPPPSTMTPAERVRAMREALEGLAQYWQKERVVRDLTGAQAALLITKPIGPPVAQSLSPRPSPPPREVRPAPPRPERPRRALF